MCQSLIIVWTIYDDYGSNPDRLEYISRIVRAINSRLNRLTYSRLLQRLSKKSRLTNTVYVPSTIPNKYSLSERERERGAKRTVSTYHSTHMRLILRRGVRRLIRQWADTRGTLLYGLRCNCTYIILLFKLR
jgi:hypothetical protein